MKVKKLEGKRNGEEDMFVVLMNRSEVEDIIVALALLDSWQAVYGKAAEPGESVDKRYDRCAHKYENQGADGGKLTKGKRGKRDD